MPADVSGVVLDASAVVEWVLGLHHAADVEARIADPQMILHAPHLVTAEVAQVVRRYVAAGEITAARGGEAISDLAALDLVCHPHEPLLPLIWRYRANLTAYDAAYVVLAEALDAPLLTLDRHLADAPHGATVELVGLDR